VLVDLRLHEDLERLLTGLMGLQFVDLSLHEQPLRLLLVRLGLVHRALGLLLVFSSVLRSDGRLALVASRLPGVAGGLLRLTLGTLIVPGAILFHENLPQLEAELPFHAAAEFMAQLSESGAVTPQLCRTDRGVTRRGGPAGPRDREQEGALFHGFHGVRTALIECDEAAGPEIECAPGCIQADM